MISKSLLNNLLGRFGFDIEKEDHKLLDNTQYEEIAAKYPISNSINLQNNWHLVSYKPRLDPELCKSLNTNMTVMMNKFKVNDIVEHNIKDVSIAVSAAITAYGRIHINQLKIDIMNLGGTIYYSDTDSIVTDIKLPDYMVSSSDIGKLKLEHKLKEGYFISSKTYALVLKDNNTVLKAKGIKSNSLTFDDYISMYKGNKISTALKISSDKNFSEGFVSIYEKNITLDPASYTKREKIYTNDVWVDTKPILIGKYLFLMPYCYYYASKFIIKALQL